MKSSFYKNDGFGRDADLGFSVPPSVSDGPGAGGNDGQSVSQLVNSAGKAFNSIHSFFGSKSSHQLNSATYQNAPTDKVTIFNDTKFNGASKSFSPGQFVWLGKSGRDKISSIKIPAGLQVEAWTGRPPSAPSGQPSDNPGEKVTWNSDQSYVGAQWNDHIDTIRVSGAAAKTTTDTVAAAIAGSNATKYIWPIAIGVGVLGLGGLFIAKSKN